MTTKKPFKIKPIKEADAISLLENRISELRKSSKILSRDVADLLLRNGFENHAGHVLMESGSEARCLHEAIRFFIGRVGFSYVRDEPLPKVSTRCAVRHSPLQHRRKG